MQEEACRHTLSALHTMLRHAVHRALYEAHSTIVCLKPSTADTFTVGPETDTLTVRPPTTDTCLTVRFQST